MGCSAFEVSWLNGMIIQLYFVILWLYCVILQLQYVLLQYTAELNTSVSCGDTTAVFYDTAAVFCFTTTVLICLLGSFFWFKWDLIMKYVNKSLVLVLLYEHLLVGPLRSSWLCYGISKCRVSSAKQSCHGDKLFWRGLNLRHSRSLASNKNNNSKSSVC